MVKNHYIVVVNNNFFTAIPQDHFLGEISY